MEQLLIFGSGGHAKVVIDVIEKAGDHQIFGIMVSKRGLEDHFLGYRVYGDDELEAIERRIGIVAIGDNWIRARVFENITTLFPDFRFVSAVHPSAQIGKAVSIGEGTVVMAGAVINSGTRIGQHCIVNTKASVDHDCCLMDFSSIAPGVTLGGNVRVGAYSAVSLGAAVLPGVSIGEHSVIGAGAVVIRDIPGKVVSFGVPGKVIRSREIGEKYL